MAAPSDHIVVTFDNQTGARLVRDVYGLDANGAETRVMASGTIGAHAAVADSMQGAGRYYGLLGVEPPAGVDPYLPAPIVSPTFTGTRTVTLVQRVKGS